MATTFVNWIMEKWIKCVKKPKDVQIGVRVKIKKDKNYLILSSIQSNRFQCQVCLQVCL